MDPHRMATMIGIVGGSAGAALVAQPDAACALLGTTDPTGVRVIGLLDMALIPGLVAGRPRWRWMAGRLALNAGIAAYLVARARADQTTRPYAVAAGLAVLSTADAKVLADLRA